jgi:hypothetical protein
MLKTPVFRRVDGLDVSQDKAFSVCQLERLHGAGSALSGQEPFGGGPQMRETVRIVYFAMRIPC